jgi:membrane protein YqaA with SNARE-associated domain
MEYFLDFGYVGLFFGSFLASTIIPLSSEILLGGMLLAGGNPWLCFVLATAGNGLGSVTSYGLGYLGKWQWIEKWMRVKNFQSGIFLLFHRWRRRWKWRFATALNNQSSQYQCQSKHQN